ncbi:rhodanese-like domain-containing protein [uncultured Pontibacter sp.]|uniref:rhodanese-like domain-containing protein n=1 Tax=uncultured Pontibacter sp. TaxID=453356 RepID=UPI0026362EEE|nr:rhodanese-like domain-containing protein [uncultured Pontibacter sp.]
MDVTSVQFQQTLKKLDKDRAYFLFCRSGSRSGTACKIMSVHGLTVYNLAGGISAWPR